VISEEIEARGQVSSTITIRLVFLIDSTINGKSIGRTERRSITSADMSSFSSSAAAARATFNIFP
jgi:hypothetical protein